MCYTQLLNMCQVSVDDMDTKVETEPSQQILEIFGMPLSSEGRDVLQDERIGFHAGYSVNHLQESELNAIQFEPRLQDACPSPGAQLVHLVVHGLSPLWKRVDMALQHHIDESVCSNLSSFFDAMASTASSAKCRLGAYRLHDIIHQRSGLMSVTDAFTKLRVAF